MSTTTSAGVSIPGQVVRHEEVQEQGLQALADACRFRFLSYAEARQRTRERARWLVESLVCSWITLLTGTPEAGKSTLMASLIVSVVHGRPFLGREVARSLDRVFVLTTEADGVEELTERLERAGVQDAPGLFIGPVRGVTREDWEHLHAWVNPDRRTLLILDNLSQVVPDGTINDDPVIRDVFTGLTRFTEAGCPVLLLHHTSNKRSANGAKSRSPMGHTSIDGGARWTVHVERTGSSLRLDCHGNGAPPHKLTLTQALGEDVTALSVTEETSADQVARARLSRDHEQAQRLRSAAQWLADQTFRGTQQEAGARLAAQFPWLTKAAERGPQVAKDLSGGRKVGRYLARDGSGVWVLRQDAPT